MKKYIASLLKRLSLDADLAIDQQPTNSEVDFSSEFVGAPGNRSISDYGGYLACVQSAAKNYNDFLVFRKHPTYRGIVEGVTYEQGLDYYEAIKSASNSFLDRIDELKINDLIGDPIKFEYSNIGYVSPITLRYIKVASDLRNIFGDSIGDEIAEIGVGYGGQLLISDKLFKFHQYDLFDLPPVLELVKRYLESHTLNSAYQTKTLNQHRSDKIYDLVVSNYAFSELPSNLQRKYIQKVMVNSKRGYLTMNSGLPNSEFQIDKLSLRELQELLPTFEVIPQKYPGNYIIIWGHK